MSAFKYKARNPDGRVLEGTIEAASLDAARAVLRGRKFSVMELAQAKGAGMFKRGPKVPAKDIVIFSRQLATMASSGMPLVQAISAIAEQTENKDFKSILLQVRDDISSGVNIAEALGKHPTVFVSLYVNMVRAGESGGDLANILDRLSTYLEKAEALQGKIKGAMMYPSIIAVVAISVVLFLMVAVIPSFESVFSSFGGELPAPTRILLGISDFIQENFLYIVGGMVGTIVGLVLFRRTDAGERATDALILKAPVFGMLMTKFTVARFSRTLGTLQKSGVPILESMEIVAKTAGNRVIESAILKARSSMREGEGVTGPLKATNVFPPMVISMVAAGEETGKMDEMLMKIADFYDQEVDTAVDNMLKLIEPILIVVMGGIVGFIVVAMFLPMFEMSSMVE